MTRCSGRYTKWSYITTLLHNYYHSYVFTIVYVTVCKNPPFSNANFGLVFEV